ncbi:MAG: single-stranded-DNA-specific exonuclease RecJ [Lachnospiraceae bacterium]|nr:single-stranded-DNA-specific exonuclease RecJ [Lachnospiraceae bacterium]
MATWYEIRKGADFMGLSKKFQIDPVIARLLINRDIKEADFASFLRCDKNNLHSPRKMKDMEKAVSIIKEAVSNNKKIRIIGDYDIDGINSTYILYSGIKRIGGDVSYAIPRRIEDGYGINPEMVQSAHEDGVEVIITCDNGIAAFPAVKKAKELGMTIVVTDHHQIPFDEVDGEKIERLVPADAVVDPHQRDDTYPYPEICGGMVAWKFITLLYEECKIPSKEAEVFMENAAFATVGDIMPLRDENRITVKLGLKAMEETKNIGLRALIAQNGLQNNPISAYHVGFVLGPCFNATGRLETADMAMELLLETDEKEAIRKAGELVSINEERKSMTAKGDKKALELMEENHMDKDSVLVLYIPELHESLCGLVAGHIKEKYYRPTFVLADGAEGVKGSGRSIEAYSMFEKMNECKDLLQKFGGHPMAAGLSLKKEDVDEFRKQMNEKANLSKEDLTPSHEFDMELPPSYLLSHEGLIDELNILEPFGNGNKKPAFAAGNVSIGSITRIGKEKQFLRFSFLADGGKIDGLFFGDSDTLVEKLKDKFSAEEVEKAFDGKPNNTKLSVSYYPQINEFRGRRSVQMIVNDYLL